MTTDRASSGRQWATSSIASRVLIGGLMVQLHALEYGITDVRPTRDIDVLGQARPPGALSAIDEALKEEGFEPTNPDIEGFAHRYQRGELIVDVLAPDGLNPAPDLGGGRKAVGVPGGSQALNRSEVVTVSVEGKAFELRRPTLLGAILIKARSIMRHADPESQREDSSDFFPSWKIRARWQLSSRRLSEAGFAKPRTGWTSTGSPCSTT
jgi:hypothetical protein